MRTTIWSCALVLVAAPTVHGGFAPVPVTPDSYNQDVIVERTAPGPVMTVTTASMDTGTNNTGFTWFERGFNADSPAAGLRAAGEVITSEALVDHDFQLPPTYRTNNAVLLDRDVPAGCLKLLTPATYSALSVLTSSANAADQIACTIHHQDGTIEAGTFISPNWFGPAGQAVAARGRVDAQSFVFANVNEENPRLYSCDITLTNVTSPVTQIDFTASAGNGHTVILALSGAPNAGDWFVPVAVTGFDYDVVVEASANRPGRVATATTATMACGAANLGYTIYEQGYLPTKPASGVPAAGSTITNAAADHAFVFAPSFRDNNAILIDPANPETTIQFATATSFSAVSFLCAGAGGSATNNCRIEHADSTYEDHTFVAPDWLSTTTVPTLSLNGRVNIDTRFPDCPVGSGPQLFAVDVVVTNATSPITHLDVSFGTGAGSDPHTVIFAVSGQTGSPVVHPGLTVTLQTGGQLRLDSTAPGVLESTTQLKGSNTVWHSEGSISQTLTINPGANEPVKFFRVRAPVE